MSLNGRRTPVLPICVLPAPLTATPIQPRLACHVQLVLTSLLGAMDHVVISFVRRAQRTMTLIVPLPVSSVALEHIRPRVARASVLFMLVLRVLPIQIPTQQLLVCRVLLARTSLLQAVGRAVTFFAPQVLPTMTLTLQHLVKLVRPELTHQLVRQECVLRALRVTLITTAILLHHVSVLPP